MGDRCSLSMRVLRSDFDAAKYDDYFARPVFVCLGDGQVRTEADRRERYVDDETPGTVLLEVQEANYAMQDEREEWAKAGLTFQGSHGEGGCYGPGLFVAHGGQLIDVEALEGRPVAGIDREGNAAPKALERIKAYYALDSLVDAVFAAADVAAAEIEIGDDDGPPRCHDRVDAKG